MIRKTQEILLRDLESQAREVQKTGLCRKSLTLGEILRACIDRGLDREASEIMGDYFGSYATSPSTSSDNMEKHLSQSVAGLLNAYYHSQ